MSLYINNHISGIQTTANMKSLAIQLSSKRLATMEKLPGDDIVSFVVGNRVNDRTMYYQGLLKSVGTGISMLQTAQTGLQRIRNLLVEQQSLLGTATGKNARDMATLDTAFQGNTRKINDIANKTTFHSVKMLDGTFGVDRTREIRYPFEVNSVSIASKSLLIGPTVFRRDNIAFLPFEASAATITLANVVDGDHIYVEGQKFTFRNNPTLQGEIKIQDTDEENARRLVTTLLNSKNKELKRYAATNIGGGMLSIQSQIRSGDAVNVASGSHSILVDNITPKADENVLNLHNLIDNAGFYGRIIPNFTLDAAPVYDAAARNLAAINGLDLGLYAGDAGDSAAKYTCKIGEKDYTGVLFVRGNGGVVQNMSAAPAGPEQGLLVMREVGNTNSSFTVNFEPTYTGILDNQPNAELIRDNLNSLFARMTFKQNRYMAVNETPESRARRLFDVKTTTATITNTKFEKLVIEDFRIYHISPTRVEFRLTINGTEYSDITVPRVLREGDRVSMEFDATNYVALTIGKGGLNLTNPDHFQDIEQAMLTFFTGQETYHEVQVTGNNFDNISTKIANFNVEELFKDATGKYSALSIINKLERRKAAIILDRATKTVLDQIARIQTSISTIESELSRINSSIDISNLTYESFTNIDLVKEGNNFSESVKELLALIAVEAGSRIIDEHANKIIQGTSGEEEQERK